MRYGFTTIRRCRDAAISSGWRWKTLAPTMSMSARRKGKAGVPAMMKIIDDKRSARPPFAPVPQSRQARHRADTNILFYLCPRLNLSPRDEEGRLWAHQLQLTITDLVVEIHDTHHPITSWLYYEEQKPAAKRRTLDFWRYRVPKFLGYFERVLQKNGGQYLIGRATLDLSIFQIIIQGACATDF